jgi:hypothetical protein
VDLANFLLNALNRTVARHLLPCAFADAVRAAIAELGANIDFARQSHRETLGLQLARSWARRPSLLSKRTHQFRGGSAASAVGTGVADAQNGEIRSAVR